MRKEKLATPLAATIVLIAVLALTAIPTAVAQEPSLLLDLTISDTARVVDYDDGIYVVGTSTGDLYVINDAGDYTVTHLADYRINDVRIENRYIAVAIDNMVKELSLPAGSLTPTLLWITTIGPYYYDTTSVDLSEDGRYVAYLSNVNFTTYLGEVGVINGINGQIISNYSLLGWVWATYWLDATGDMEYIAITDEPCPPGPSGTQSGVEVYRFDGSSITRVNGTRLIYRYETTEVRISENKDYVAAATSSGPDMVLLDLTATELSRYNAGAEQFAVDGDDNLNYVIGGTQYDPSYGPIYKWFVLKNDAGTLTLIANGTMNGNVNDLDSSPDAGYLAFGSDAGDVLWLKRTDDSVETVFDFNVSKRIDAIEIGTCSLLVGGDRFIKLYSCIIKVSKITGVGYIPGQSSASAFFGIAGLYSKGVANGYVEYKDKDLRIKSTIISMVMTSPDKKKGWITGYAEVYGADSSHYFKVYVEDNLDPVKGDYFKISVPDISYTNGNYLTSGHIRIWE